MEITFNDFCNRVKEDTEETVPKVDQYREAVKYFNKVHETGGTVSFSEAFTPFQNGVLEFLNEKFEKKVAYSVKDPKVLFVGKYSDFRYGYNYAKKAMRSN